MQNRIALYGGSFNPPGLHHKKIIQQILERKLADEVIVLPAGYQKNKDFIPPLERKKLIEMTFSDIKNVFIDFVNIDQNTFIVNAQYEEKYANLGKIIHVIGEDQLEGGHENSLLVNKWLNGKGLFENSEFIVINRIGYNQEKFMPSNYTLLETDGIGSSTEIRKRIQAGESIDNLVEKEVAEYIHRNNLYKN